MAQQILWIYCVWLLVAIDGTRAEYQLPKEQWAGRFTSNEGELFGHLPPTGQYSIVTWHYDITVFSYDQHQPKPIFFFRQQQRSHEYFNNARTCLNTLIFYVGDPRLVELDDRYCNLQNGNLRCIGEIELAAVQPVVWQASVAYECDHRRPPLSLNLSYNITLTPYENITCSNIDQIERYRLSEELQPMLDTLSSLYDTYSTWNFLGLSPAHIRDLSTIYPILSSYTCYKHMSELLLRLIFPECRNGQVIYQCSEMCEDFRAGCGDIDDVLFIYTQGCFSLQHRGSGSCVYNEVTCDDELAPPSNGYISADGNTTVGSKRTFSCEAGYELSGDDTVVCGYGGTWDSTNYPDCRKIPETLDKSIIIISSIMGCLLILILVIAFIVYAKFRYEVIVLIFKYCPWLLCCARFHKRYEIKLQDAFVAYHDDDEDYVKSNIQEPLEKLGYKLFVDYRDGKLGQPILRYLADAIAQSHRVILVLSQQFLDDSRCGYMLDQAFYQTLEGQQFQVIIVLMAEEKQLKNIPRFLRVFLRAGGTVHKDDQMFLSSMSYKMPTKGVVTVSEQTGVSKHDEGMPINLESILFQD